MKSLNIGFCGNFEAKHSTENDRVWAFNKLGHNVVAFQENKITIDDLIKETHEQGIDLFVYSHTHGWEIPMLIEFFELCKDRGVPVISVHLDRWAWLEREKDVGVEATWKVDHMFMADGSPEAEELYKKHNLSWSYLQPGVDERGCYMAAPDPVRFPHEIIFVGSKGYHPEYPFRPKLVEFLEKTYGDRFGHYGDGLPSLRGHDLNTLYASAKVVVGDSCFGDRPKYWSDRVTETLGRGGFLIHPKVADLPTNIMGTYKAGDLEDVKNKIDIWLKQENDRKRVQKFGHEYVKKNATYTNRAEEILDYVNDKL